MSYLTPIRATRARLTEKKSEFLAFGYLVKSRSEVYERVDVLKSSHSNASHYCSAYIIGDPRNTTFAGFDDDGEPSGVAGKPMLNVLMHNNIGNCLLVVVRYFGGAKLGAGGLTRAYSKSAQKAIEAMTLEPFVETSQVLVATEFCHEARVRFLLEQVHGEVIRSDYKHNVELVVTLPKAHLAVFRESIGGIAACTLVSN